MKKEKQPEWLSKHLEENNVEVPIFPETYGFDLGEKYAHVSKFLVNFKGENYWTYATVMSDKRENGYLQNGVKFLHSIVRSEDREFLTEQDIEDYYSKV